MIDIGRIASNLKPLEDGLWASAEARSVFYPEGAHGRCFRLEEQSFWFRHRNACLLEVISRLPPAGALFDVGGGNGYVTLALCRRGIESVLVEPGMQGVRNAMARGLRPVICSTLQGAGFRPGSLPALGMFDVLEHMADDTAFLRTARQLVADGGRLYLTVPAYGFLWSDTDDMARHFRRYTLGGLARTLRSAGFEVEYATYIFWPLPLPVFLLRTVPSWLGLWRDPARKARRDHAGGGASGASLLRPLLRDELRRIRRGWPIRFGGSCLVVARACARRRGGGRVP